MGANLQAVATVTRRARVTRMRPKDDAPIVPDSDVVALLEGTFEDLKNTFTALTAHAFNHRTDVQPAVLTNLTEGFAALKLAMNQMQCDECQRLAVSRRSTEFYCAEHDALWTVCPRCQQDTLVSETFSVGDDDTAYCEACLPSGEDE